MTVFGAVLRRELRLAARRPLEAVLPLVFVASAAVLFPLGAAPAPALLRAMGPGVLWACALLASLLSVPGLYAGDAADGSLDQMLLADEDGLSVVAAKTAGHWLVAGLPVALAAPVAGAAFGLDAREAGVLAASLAAGTPALSLLGAFGAALTLGLRGGALLLVAVVLPLAAPVLVFGAGAVAALPEGGLVGANLALAGAASLLAAVVSLPAGAAALRGAVR